MQNFQQMRANMVDCQIHTHGVVSEAILRTFQTTPREVFVPPEKASIAYCDEDIDLGSGRTLLEPGVHARMVQALDLSPEDAVLDIGGAAGYSGVILSQLCSTVIALEEREYIEYAEKVISDMEVCNIAFVEGDLELGAQKYAPFDAIFFNGAFSEIPENILKQLKEGGRFIGILRENPNSCGKAVLYERVDNEFSYRVLFDCNTPYLSGFEPKNRFSL